MVEKDLPMKLTQEQLAEKKRKDAIQRLINQVNNAWTFKSIHTWGDVYKFTGIPQATPSHQSTEKSVVWVELKAYLAALLNPEPTNESQSKPSPLIAAVPSVVIIPPPVTETIEQADDSSNDYGLVASQKEKAFHYWFQKKAIKVIVDAILIAKKKAVLLLAATGTGKTFMCAGVLRRLLDVNFHQGKTFGTVRYLYVTKATVVEQTDRVFRLFYDMGIKDCVEVLNIEQLRSRAGKQWLDEISYIEDGIEKFKWVWKPMLNPCVVIWDECQTLKNSTSTQHQIACALNDLPNVIQVFVSATPFTRVSEAKCFAVATGKDISKVLGLPNYTPITNENWPAYAAIIAGKSDPEEYNEAAVERLIDDLEDYIVRVRGVRPQFDARNSVRIIEFASPEEKKEYDIAWEKYQKELAKLKAAAVAMNHEAGHTLSNADGEPTGLAMLVMFLKFRMAAERCRRRYIAEWLIKQVNSGFAGVAALNFKGTIIDVVKILVDEYGVPRDKISLVWGGGQTQLTKKQKAKKEIIESADKLRAAGISDEALMKTLNLEDVEDRVLQELPPHLRLGSQSKEERQKEIDRFQSGRSLICLYTFRAGGVGLSLHHSDEMTSIKVRKKKSGYAVEEDIPKVPVRPRKTVVAPTYSAIELVQGLGRAPRLTSLSDTYQELVFYKGTIEEDVAAITSNKLRCLSKVVRQRETWADVITDGVKVDEHIDKNVKEESGTNYDDLSNEAEEDEDENQ